MNPIDSTRLAVLKRTVGLALHGLPGESVVEELVGSVSTTPRRRSYFRSQGSPKASFGVWPAAWSSEEPNRWALAMRC